jgi:hypothetical protein
MIFSLLWLASHPWLLPYHHRRQQSEEEELNRRRAHTKQNNKLTLFSFLPSRRKPPSLPPPTLDDMNLFSFLQDSCPSDLLPKILAFCTPQTVAALSRVNWTWYRLIMDDATWRVLCEELYKVSASLYSWNGGCIVTLNRGRCGMTIVFLLSLTKISLIRRTRRHYDFSGRMEMHYHPFPGESIIRQIHVYRSIILLCRQHWPRVKLVLSKMVPCNNRNPFESFFVPELMC